MDLYANNFQIFDSQGDIISLIVRHYHIQNSRFAIIENMVYLSYNLYYVK